MHTNDFNNLIIAEKPIELTIFNIGDLLLGIDISHVKEINRHIDVTKLHSAPDYIRGVMNLRGLIVTIIDLRIKFHLPPIEKNNDMRIIIVQNKGESIGLLVDRVDDIVIADSSDITQPPSNATKGGKYFSGIYQIEDSLISIVNIEEILNN